MICNRIYLIYYTKTAQSHYQIIILKLSNAFFQAVFPATASFLTPSLVLPVRIEALRRSLDSLLTERSTRSFLITFRAIWRGLTGPQKYYGGLGAPGGSPTKTEVSK